MFALQVDSLGNIFLLKIYCSALLYYLRPFAIKDILGVSEDTTTDRGVSARNSISSAKEVPFSNVNVNQRATNELQRKSGGEEEYPSDSDTDENTRGTLRTSAMYAAPTSPAAVEAGKVNNSNEMKNIGAIQMPQESPSESSSHDSDSDDDSSSEYYSQNNSSL